MQKTFLTFTFFALYLKKIEIKNKYLGPNKQVRIQSLFSGKRTELEKATVLFTFNEIGEIFNFLQFFYLLRIIFFVWGNTQKCGA